MLFNWLNAIVLAGLAGFMILEALAPARKLPDIRGWRLRGLAFTAVYFIVAAYSPLLWHAWIGHVQLFDLSAVPLVAQVLAGYFAIQFIGYLWHRTMHKSDLLWRVFHQMHHSQERLDAFGAFYFHPLDALGFTFVGSLGLTLVGVSPIAIAVIAVGGALISALTHTNVKTPRWLGYIVARPESHALHHGRGHHAQNYSELPLVDMIFGTFVNPRERVAETGFYDGASARVGAMLMFRDVSKPRESAAESPRRPGRFNRAEFTTLILEAALATAVGVAVVAGLSPLV